MKTTTVLIPILIFLATALGAPPATAATEPPMDLRVSPQWVHDRLREDKKNWMVVEVSWGDASQAYDKGHVPGAIHINTDEIEYDHFPARRGTPGAKLGRSTTQEEDLAKGISPDQTLPRNHWRIYPDRFLLPALAHMGITRESRVMVTSHDILAAARLTWTLLYAGVADVRILDGGLTAWKDAGFTVSTTPVQRRPQNSFGLTRPGRPQYKADIDQVRNLVRQNAPVDLLDTRTWPEFSGVWAPYSYIPTKGRIPRSLWIGSGTTPWNVEHLLQADARFKPPAELAREWETKGAKGRKTIFYCGTGWRSSVAFILARAAGWKEIQNMDGGWMIWSMENHPTPQPEK
ncbi:MAG: hypothetical protein MI747_14385 [Desulfobacterales bacterium]|nr:hypothetical protein [Desulfobacterales bacterium]